jgi:hypothetical protein
MGGLQEYSVVVQGRRTDPTAGIITIVSAVGGQPIFRYAVRAEGILYLTNGGVFDAFDSDVAPYSPLTADTIANIWANGDMTIAKTTVKGSATAAGTITLGQNGIVTGATASAAKPLTPMDIIPCPAAFTPTAEVPTGPGVSYNSSNGVVTVSGGATLTLTDTAYYFSSIVLTGNSKLAFPGNPHASVVLRDSLNAAAGTIINASTNASALSFASCGTSATAAFWALSSGGTASYYSVYAPNHIVYETGAGDFYGAVVASIYYATGGGKFHYDAALARQASKKVAVQGGSWAQLPGG